MRVNSLRFADDIDVIAADEDETKFLGHCKMYLKCYQSK